MERWRGLSGWRRSAVLFVLGALCVFLFAPFNLWPLLFLLLPAFFLILDSAPGLRQAALDGFWFGYGYFMVGTYWIAISLTVDAERFAWMIPFSLFGLSALLALYFLLFAVLFHRLKRSGLVRRLLLFAALWVAVEWVRSSGLFGFPWNLIGYALVEAPPLLQLASITGIYGLSLLALLMALAVVPWLQPHQNARRFSFATAGVVLIVAVWGMGRIEALQRLQSPYESSPKLRLVQANIPQRMKWDDAEVARIFATYRALSQAPWEGRAPDIVIWPETALAPLLREDSDWVRYLPEALPAGAQLISGVVEERAGQIHNALIVVDDTGRITGRYAKRQLVPFGEFIPLRRWLPLERIAPGPRDFTPGASDATVRAEGIPAFQPLICYESVFPSLAQSQGRKADWLLTLTNDAWFGNSPGPYQHLAMARVRAVEQGVPLVRVANTGISALIAPSGQVVRNLELSQRGRIDISLPRVAQPTRYSKSGDYAAFVVLLTMLLLAVRYAGSTCR